jgi:hypothetical protein
VRRAAHFHRGGRAVTSIVGAAGSSVGHGLGGEQVGRDRDGLARLAAP